MSKKKLLGLFGILAVFGAACAFFRYIRKKNLYIDPEPDLDEVDQHGQDPYDDCMERDGDIPIEPGMDDEDGQE